MSTLAYHLRELSVARDPSHRNHLLPRFELRHHIILDIGCGMGQTLLAAGLSSDMTAYGVDPDAEAIAAGLRVAPPNVHLSVGRGEYLKFPDNFFDLVICRVALPYMKVSSTLGEIKRVLKPGGEAWLVLHSCEMYKRRAAQSLHSGNLKDVVYCGCVAINSLLFHVSGRQLSLGERTETFQTMTGIRRALKRVELVGIKVEQNAFFIAEASKDPHLLV